MYGVRVLYIRQLSAIPMPSNRKNKLRYLFFEDPFIISFQCLEIYSYQTLLYGAIKLSEMNV